MRRVNSVQFWQAHGYFVAAPVLPDVPNGFRIANPKEDTGKEFLEWGCARPGSGQWCMEIHAERVYPRWIEGTIYIVKDAPARIVFDSNGSVRGFVNTTCKEVAGKSFRIEEI